MYATKWLFVQGHRQAEGFEPEVRRTISWLKNQDRRWGVLVGSHGRLVELFIESGLEYASLHHGDPQVENRRYVVDCLEMAGERYKGTREWGLVRRSWGLRFGIWTGDANALLFFSGRRATISHLVPHLTQAIAGHRRGLGMQRTALVGWSPEKLNAIALLTDLEWSLEREWLQVFDLEQIDDALGFLLADA